MVSDRGKVITRRMPLSSLSKATFAGGGETSSTRTWYAREMYARVLSAPLTLELRNGVGNPLDARSALRQTRAGFSDHDLPVVPCNVLGEQLAKTLEEPPLGAIGVLEMSVLAGECGRRDLLVISSIDAVATTSTALRTSTSWLLMIGSEVTQTHP
jgi:hypothetical protein